MEKPTKPKRKRAAKKPTRKTPNGNMKSDTVYKAQLESWVGKEKEKDLAHQKELTVYEKELKVYEAQANEIEKLKAYKPGFYVKKKKQG